MRDSPITGLNDLSDRSRHILRHIVESYLATGEPVGSRTLSHSLPLDLSPASIRNVMSDLEHLGLLLSPHTSAGRLPTELGLRLFVDGLLEVGDLTEDERASIEAQIAGSNRSVEDALTEATTILSGLSECAGLVVAPKADARLKHLEFVAIAPGKVMAVLVSEDGQVENRILHGLEGVTPSALRESSNYLSARLAGRTIAEARAEITKEIAASRDLLDELSAKIIEAGLATWSGDADAERPRALIVRGQSQLLRDAKAIEDLERIRQLFDDLEQKQEIIRLLDSAQEAEGVRIFIGSETKLFSLSGSSLVVAPYMNPRDQIVGVVGVIGPTRLNYARIIPMVDYTARVIGRLVE